MASSDDGRHTGRLESDPWRYLCPDCGSHDLYERVGTGRPAGKQYPANGHGPVMAREDEKKRFTCQTCGERKAYVIDKKRRGSA